MALDTRIAFLSEGALRHEAERLALTLYDRLPKAEVFRWEESWRVGWSGEQLRLHAAKWESWADLILCLGPRAVWDQMSAWPEMARWSAGGKILWLHLPPSDRPEEAMLDLNDLEVMPVALWSRIEPLIVWLSDFAERTRSQRQARAEEEERRSLWEKFFREERDAARNPYDRGGANAKVLGRRLRGPDHSRGPDRDEMAKQWEKECETAKQQRWRAIESASRGTLTISADDAAERKPELEEATTPRVPFGSKVQQQADPKLPSATDAAMAAVYAPRQWVSGDTELVQFWVFPEEEATTVETEAISVDEAAQRLRAQVLNVDIARGTRLSMTLLLDVPCEVNPPVAALVWRGEAVSISFAVKSFPVEYRVRVLGTVEVRMDHVPVPIGILHFRVELVPKGTPAEKLANPLCETTQRTEWVFISYASEDRSEVLRRVQGLKALGIKFFQDILELSPGQRWKEELWRHIDQCHVFLLCWSSAARQSEWVRKEYLRALNVLSGSRRHYPHITILPLEGPPPPKPPEELAHLHFSDDLLYALKVEGDLAAERHAQKRDDTLTTG
jgi:TIR domain